MIRADHRMCAWVLCDVAFLRTPSKQKSPKKEEWNIVELLRGHEPKEYEKILREHDIQDYRAILQAIELLKKEKEAEPGKTVREKVAERQHNCAFM